MTANNSTAASKKKIVVFIDWYLPGFKAGGPIKSCVSLVERLKSYFHFKIITGDTDLNETVPYKNINSNAWNVTDRGTEVFYAAKNYLSSKTIENLLLAENPEVIYLNSMFSWNFTLLPLWVIRNKKIKSNVVVAPRGMLSKGALALKPVKKSLFLTAAKTLGLFRNVTFHASTEIEVNEIKNVFGKDVKIIHAINLTPEHKIVHFNRTKNKNKVNLVYVGRISEVKNLLQCLQVLKKTAAISEFHFDIYGPHDDENYLDLCKKEIASMPSHVQANLKGPADNAGITALLKNYDFLFLLSMNENYGHAIVEGLSAGCPVIIGNRTPWRNLEAKKCGWDLSLEDDNSIVETLDKVGAMDQITYDQWSKASSDFAKQIHENKKAIDDHLQLFNS